MNLKNLPVTIVIILLAINVTFCQTTLIPPIEGDFYHVKEGSVNAGYKYYNKKVQINIENVNLKDNSTGLQVPGMILMKSENDGFPVTFTIDKFSTNYIDINGDKYVQHTLYASHTNYVIRNSKQVKQTDNYIWKIILIKHEANPNFYLEDNKIGMAICEKDGNKNLTFYTIDAGKYENDGIDKLQKHDYKGAIIDFNIVIAFNPNDSQAISCRGAAKSSLNDYNGAMRDLNRAIEVDSKSTLNYQNRGEAKYKVKDYKGSIADFDKAILLDGENEWAYKDRGLAKIMLGQKESGCLDLNKAANLFDPEAKKLIIKYCN